MSTVAVARSWSLMTVQYLVHFRGLPMLRAQGLRKEIRFPPIHFTCHASQRRMHSSATLYEYVIIVGYNGSKLRIGGEV